MWTQTEEELRTIEKVQDDDMMKSLEDEREDEEVDDEVKNLRKSTTEASTIWSPVALTRNTQPAGSKSPF